MLAQPACTPSVAEGHDFSRSAQWRGRAAQGVCKDGAVRGTVDRPGTIIDNPLQNNEMGCVQHVWQGCYVALPL